MAEIPKANVAVNDEAGAFAGAGGYIAVFACVERNADLTPRVFASSKSLVAQHGYFQGADYLAMHFGETRLPAIVVGLPTVTAGAVGRVNSSGVTGTCAITVAAGAAGILEETEGELTVTKGGTIGTDQIAFDFSADGGRSKKPVRLGTAASYAVPYLGYTLNFGAGTLNVGDKFTFKTTAPRWDSAGITAARQALAAQNKTVRSVLVVGDLADADDAEDIVDEMNLYETANQRFTFARVQVRDRLPQAELSKNGKKMTGNPNLTFAEVGGTGDTITRSAGSWIADGFAVGDWIVVTGSASNNVAGPIASLTATVITLGTTDLAAEGPVAGVSVTAYETLTFAEVGGTGDTITRNRGSWLADGFRVGDEVTVAGTGGNNVTGPITAVTATVMTFGTTDLAAEVIGALGSVSITAGETMAAWVAEMDAEFAGVDDEKRIDLGLGRLRKKSPINGWKFRRPVQWAASIREYQHDVHITTWWKALGPLSGFELTDNDGNIVEYDELTDGGGLAGRFTCARTWANGPEGAFIAMSLTRASEGSLLSLTHNMQVVNIACTITQAETERAVGQTLILTAEGKGDPGSLSLIEKRVNKALQVGLLQQGAEGPRASSVVWSASRNDILNVPNAKLNGSLVLNLNGTLVQVDTGVRVQTAGA